MDKLKVGADVVNCMVDLLSQDLSVVRFTRSACLVVLSCKYAPPSLRIIENVSFVVFLTIKIRHSPV